MPPQVADGVRRAAAIMADARDPWWIIGSAALSLHGIAVDVADIDILTSERDAAARGGRWPTGDTTERDRFRSCFVRITGTTAGAELPIEVMGALTVRRGGRRIPVEPGPPVAIPLTAGTDAIVVPVPDLAAMAKMLALFGRPKDERRAALLATRRSW